MINYFLLVLMTFLGALGALFLKKSSNHDTVLNQIKSPNLYLGGVFYGAGAVLNIHILNFLRYTVVMPMTSLTYIWTMFFSYYFLKEKITKRKMAGIFLIVAGAVCAAI